MKVAQHSFVPGDVFRLSDIDIEVYSKPYSDFAAEPMSVIPDLLMLDDVFVIIAMQFSRDAYDAFVSTGDTTGWLWAIEHHLRVGNIKKIM